MSVRKKNLWKKCHEEKVSLGQNITRKKCHWEKKSQEKRSQEKMSMGKNVL